MSIQLDPIMQKIVDGIFECSSSVYQPTNSKEIEEAITDLRALFLKDPEKGLVNAIQLIRTLDFELIKRNQFLESLDLAFAEG